MLDIDMILQGRNVIIPGRVQYGREDACQRVDAVRH